MEYFQSEGVRIAYRDEGEGPAIVLVHGFASTHLANWVEPGWTSALQEAGYRTVLFDLRGHGRSGKLYDPADYSPALLARDLAGLIEHLGLKRPHVMGYSLGAMIGLRLACDAPRLFGSLIAGGVGARLFEPPSHVEPVIAAMEANDPASITDPAARAFRIFADHNKQDRKALAACFARAREPFTRQELSRIAAPVLVIAGERDDLAGPPGPLADAIPGGQAHVVPRRDHMRSVGDAQTKRAVLGFLEKTARV